MASIAPMTTYMGGKQPPNKMPVTPLKTGQSTVVTAPKRPPAKKKGKRIRTPISP